MESTVDQAKRAKRYHALKNRLFFVHLFVNIIFLIVLLLSGLSLALKNFSYQFSSHFLVINGIYIAIFSIGMYVLCFPLNFLEGFFWEHHFKLSNQKFTNWLWDDFKKGLIGLLVTILAIEVVYIFLRRFPDNWWIGAAAFWLLLSLVLARLMPSVIIPLFYKYSDIDNKELKARILELFKKCNLKIKNAYAINFSSKTKKANALICGLGNNRRVILTDNLLNHFTIGEIETVMAHEIGHYKGHDILKLTAVNSMVTFVSFFLIDRFLRQSLTWFGFTRIDDIAFFPMMALSFVVLGFFVMPLLNAYSRNLEVKADTFSLKLTQKPNDLISAFRKLGSINLSEFEPNLLTEILFYDHPPLSKRINLIEHFKTSSHNSFEGK